MARIQLVYIAGPFRAATPWEVEQNVRRAEALSVAVARMPGLFPVCPHTMGRYLSGAAPDEVWLEGDLELMRRCDAVLLVPGWKQSSGTVAEVTEARRMGLPVFAANVACATLGAYGCQRLFEDGGPGDLTLSEWVEHRKAVTS